MAPQPEPLPLQVLVAEPAVSRTTLVVSVAGGLLLAAMLAVSHWGGPGAPAGAPPEVPSELAARHAAQFAGAQGRLLPVDLSTQAAQDAAVSMIPAPEPVARQLVAEALAGRRALGKVSVWY